MNAELNLSDEAEAWIKREAQRLADTSKAVKVQTECGSVVFVDSGELGRIAGTLMAGVRVEFVAGKSGGSA